MQTQMFYYEEVHDKMRGMEKYLEDMGSENSGTEKIKRMKAIIRAAIEKELTERQRMILQKFYRDSMSAAQIAAELDISTSTVYKHLRLARKKLQGCGVYL